MALTDRRRHPRWEVRGVRAWMYVNKGKAVPCRIIDVSRKGVLVKSSQFLARGATIELAFARNNGPKVTRLFRRWAQVARSTPGTLAVYFVHARSGAGKSARRI